jgi:hypothetical protein
VTAPWCKDCLAEGVTAKRKLARYRSGNQVPGPRCSTHHRAKRAATKDTTWNRYLVATYGITAEDYWAIYEFQGGVCYICRRAKGTGRKKLSVDHCHKTGVVRGLVCGPCNRDVLGHLRDDTAALQRAIDYLTSPPAVAVLGVRITPDTDLTLNGDP